MFFLCLCFHCRSIHTFDPTPSPTSSVTSSASCLSCQFTPLILGSACSSLVTTSTMSTLILLETAMKVTATTASLNVFADKICFRQLQLWLFPCPHALAGCQKMKQDELPNLVFHTSHCCQAGGRHYLRCWLHFQGDYFYCGLVKSVCKC